MHNPFSARVPTSATMFPDDLGPGIRYILQDSKIVSDKLLPNCAALASRPES